MGGRTVKRCSRSQMTRTREIRSTISEKSQLLRNRFEFVVFVIDRDKDTAGAILGNAVAFRLFLFVFPVILTVVGLLGFLSSSMTVDGVSEVTGLEGALRTQIEAALTQSQSTRWVALVVGLWGTLWSGRALAKTLISVSAFAWRVPIRRKVTFRTLMAITGVLVAVFVTAGVIGRIRADAGVAVATIGFGVVAVVYLVGWFLITVLLPRTPSDPTAVLPGAILMGVTITAMQWFSQIWLPDRFSRASQLYGALGTTAVTLAIFFVIGRLFVWSMVLNATIWERFGSLSTMTFSLPGFRRIPIRFRGHQGPS